MNPPNFAYTHSGVPFYPPLGYGIGLAGAQLGSAQQERDGFQEYGTFSESNGILDGLASVVFDPGEELVWTGSQTVRFSFSTFESSIDDQFRY